MPICIAPTRVNKQITNVVNDVFCYINLSLCQEHMSCINLHSSMVE